MLEGRRQTQNTWVSGTTTIKKLVIFCYLTRALNFWVLIRNQRPKVPKYEYLLISRSRLGIGWTLLKILKGKPSKIDHFLKLNRLILVRRRPPVQTRASTTATAPNVSLHSVECRKNKNFHPRFIFRWSGCSEKLENSWKSWKSIDFLSGGAPRSKRALAPPRPRETFLDTV